MPALKILSATPAGDLGELADAVDVPITGKDVPNIYVSVMLVKGRTSNGPARDDGPSCRVGYTELSVDDPSARLRVDVSADRDEYRPGEPATIAVAVISHDGKPAPAEVALWAIDRQQSPASYTIPDLRKVFHAPKPLQVMTTDNRHHLMSRGPMPLVTAGVCCGVEGAQTNPSEWMAAEALERSARDAFMAARRPPGDGPLLFWLGSAATDAAGRATTTVTLPDSARTYRILAVAGNEASQFGSGESEIRVTTVTVK